MGVGAGYFLDRYRFPAPAPRVTGRRSNVRNVLAAIPFEGEAFDPVVEVVGGAALFSARR